jgi:hypothetical protein
MNTDIRISTSFLNHRKRKKLQQILGVGSTDYLIDLWINTAINRPKGILYDMDKDDIALDAGWDGKADYFVDVLLQVGFLDYDGEWFKLHDWAKHQSWAVNADERSEQARKAALARWGVDADSKGVEQSSEDADSIPAAQEQDTDSNPPILSSPILSEPEEKETPFRAIDFLIGLGVEKQKATDFLKNRKTRRLANTLTAFEGLQREIEKTELTPDKIITICCEKGWGSFKASWDYKGGNGKGDNGLDHISLETSKTCGQCSKYEDECGFKSPGQNACSSFTTSHPDNARR